MKKKEEGIARGICQRAGEKATVVGHQRSEAATQAGNNYVASR